VLNPYSHPRTSLAVVCPLDHRLNSSLHRTMGRRSSSGVMGVLVPAREVLLCLTGHSLPHHSQVGGEWVADRHDCPAMPRTLCVDTMPAPGSVAFNPNVIFCTQMSQTDESWQWRQCRVNLGPFWREWQWHQWQQWTRFKCFYFSNTQIYLYLYFEFI